MANKTTTMNWTEPHDEMLCREIILVQPFAYKTGSREKGQAWSRISETLNSIEQPKFNVSQRSVREHFSLILTRFRAKLAAERADSGANHVLKPSEALLEDINIRIIECESEFDAKSKEKQSKVESENQAISDARAKAMENLSETLKRKNNDETCSANTKGKRQRSTGSETYSYLREKSEKDNELKKAQIEIQRLEAQNFQALTFNLLTLKHLILKVEYSGFL
ncbi:uncharacterized protein [Clytia hemisphaerica]|uniref:uncharacterized protein n=1 Tax=Clytia hemisphaerica TaxID=252671 RepID=UPI0034D7613A